MAGGGRACSSWAKLSCVLQGPHVVSDTFISTPVLPLWVKPATKTMPTAAGDTPGALPGRTSEDFSMVLLTSIPSSTRKDHGKVVLQCWGPILRWCTAMDETHLRGKKINNNNKKALLERWFAADPNPPCSPGLAGRVPLEGAAGSACAAPGGAARFAGNLRAPTPLCQVLRVPTGHCRSLQVPAGPYGHSRAAGRGCS